MRRNSILFISIAAMSVPAIAFAQDARSILDTMQQKQVERWGGVDNYVVESSVMNNATKLYFQRTEVTDDNGGAHTVFLPISSNRRTTDSCEGGAVQMTPEAWEAYAQGLEVGSDAMGQEIEKGLEDAGLPRGLLAASGSSPTATFDPRVMLGGGADFIRAGADAQREKAQEGARNAAEAEDSADQMIQFRETAELIGTETIDGKPAYHLRSESINQVQEVDGEEYRMEAMSLWIDTKDYVILQMKMDGTVTSGKESQPMSIENLMTDYRAVPESNMYESYKQITKISGMMDEGQQSEMSEAMKQLEELENQMASMPESQRQMMENMMGPQLEMIQNMASGGGFQIEKIVTSITVNPPMAAQDGTPCSNATSELTNPAPAAASAPAEARDNRQETETASNTETDGAYVLGEPRNDLERFYGIYGDGNSPSRDFFVSEAQAPRFSEQSIPPGYLMIGGKGDAASLYMKSLSDAEFEQQWVNEAQAEPVVVEFDLSGDGSAVALTFKTMYTDRGRLQRLKDLPSDWQ